MHGRQRLDDGDAIMVGRTQLVFVAGPGGARRRRPPAAARRPSCRPRSSGSCTHSAPRCSKTGSPRPPSNREIAAELFIGVETVKSHLHALFELFGVGDMPQNRKRAELVRLAFERGAVPVPSRSR